MRFLDTLLALVRPPIETARRYDAAASNHLRRVPSDTRSGNGLMDATRDRPRRWARHLDENVDLVHGLLTSLALRASAVTVEPTALTSAGELAEDLNGRLSELWEAQGDELEITGLYSQTELRQTAARTWLRDGEVFGLHMEATPGVEFGTVPYGIQCLEPDYLPFDSTLPNVVHGIRLSSFGRPMGYHFKGQHPGDYSTGPENRATHNRRQREQPPTPASEVMHLARRDRLHQLRGVSCLASAITRLDDSRDMEESERLAARMAAAACVAITRQPGLEAVSVDSDIDERSMYIEGGMIFDDLLPGEGIENINPTRPNVNAIPWREAQMRAVASGTDASYSTMARDYSGTYSSQRQELVESQFLVKERLAGPFIARFWRPTYRRFASAAIRHGIIAPRYLRGVDTSTLTLAEFNLRGVPWIDMLKEVQAEAAAVEAGFKTRRQVIRERGGDPRQVDAGLARDTFTPPVSQPASSTDAA